MKLEKGRYYHIYNRSNARERLFRSHENYIYFLANYRRRFRRKITTLAYCLMPTHFHFLVKINSDSPSQLSREFGSLLSSYVKAFNKCYGRNGSLFQQHTKAKLVNKEGYLLLLVSYIHQNPVRARLVRTLEEWPYSSYPDLSGNRNGTLISKEIIGEYFDGLEGFIRFSQQSVRI